MGGKPMAKPIICRFCTVGGFSHLLADFCRQSWPNFLAKNLNFGFKNVAQKLRIRGRLNFYQPISWTQRSIWAIACVNRLFVIHKPTLRQSFTIIFSFLQKSAKILENPQIFFRQLKAGPRPQKWVSDPCPTKIMFSPPKWNFKKCKILTNFQLRIFPVSCWRIFSLTFGKRCPRP